MKRYEIEHVAPYAHDPGCVFENPVETVEGDWVPADVAQGLYDALDMLLDAAGEEGLRFAGHADAMDQAAEALKAADGSES